MKRILKTHVSEEHKQDQFPFDLDKVNAHVLPCSSCPQPRSSQAPTIERPLPPIGSEAAAKTLADQLGSVR